jgi:Na+-driven multidrug efflux pump
LRLLGAAWATILARAFTLCPLLYLVINRFGLFRRGARGGLDRRTAREIITIAWPSSTQLVLRILAMLAVHALVARHFTTQSDQSATTALGIVFRLETMALFVGLGWGSAAQTFVGQNLGAGHERRAAQSGWYAAFYNLAAMALLVLAYRRFGASLVTFFDEDPRVVEMALGYLAVVAPSYPALGLGIVLGSAMTGAGATRITMFIDLAVILAFQLPFAVAATSFGGASETRLWLAVAVTNVLSAAVYAISYRKGTFLQRAVVGVTGRTAP